MLNPSGNDIKWFDSFMKTNKFNWIKFGECFEKDGIYFYSPHWDSKSDDEIKDVAKFHLFGDCDYNHFFSTIQIKDGKCTRFGNNTEIKDEDIEYIKNLYQDYRFAWICDE